VGANLVTISKFSATVVIGVGACLVGLIAGWDLAPLTLELGRTQLAAVCAVIGVVFGVTGCCIASERADAHARKQQQLTSLTRLGVLIARSIREDQKLRHDHVTISSS
jgi:hypothetical protein